jgi:hypothetical protein
VETPKAPESPPESLELPGGDLDEVPGPANTANTADSVSPESHDDASRDDISVPPIGLDSAFFSETPAVEGTLEVETRDPRASLKHTPAAIRRRAQLAKYVTVAVALAGVVCAAALVKVARGHEEAPRAMAVARIVAATAGPALNAAPTTEHEKSTVLTENSNATDKQEPVADPSPAEQSAGSAVTETQATGATPPAAGEPAAAPETATAVPAETSAAPAAVEAPLDPKEVAKEAAKAKVKARGALEWGKMGDAIAAGEKSVDLDPTDAEAWLILGAAYQEKGDSKNAIRSFKACLDQGKRGPRNECAAMLR